MVANLSRLLLLALPSVNLGAIVQQLVSRRPFDGLHAASPPRREMACLRTLARHGPRLSFGLEFPEEDDQDNENDDEQEEKAVDTTAGFNPGGGEEVKFTITQDPAANMTVAELQTELRRVGQKHTGTKKELVERVQMLQRKHALGLPLHDLQVQPEDDFRWYMLQTANGFERAVERNINLAISAQRLQSKSAFAACASCAQAT